MAKQNPNPFSPFLVKLQKEGAEKALIKLNAALFAEWLPSLFSSTLFS